MSKRASSGGERKTVLHNVARSLVSMVRGSGIRKDYFVEDEHGAFLPSECKPRPGARLLPGPAARVPPARLAPRGSGRLLGPGRCEGVAGPAPVPLC